MKINSMVSGMVALGMASVTYAENTLWTGWYAGVDAKSSFSDAQLSSQQLGFTNPSDTCNQSSNYSIFSSGAQLGYLYQASNSFVSGVEINATVNNNQKHNFSCYSAFNPGVYDGFTLRNQMQTSVKGRVGHEETWGQYRLLPYMTAGMSIAKMGLSYQNEGGNYYNTEASYAGWLIGAGLEWAITQHWSFRVEYSYVDYGRNIKLNLPTVYGLNDPNGVANMNLSTSNIDLAVNYWV